MPTIVSSPEVDREQGVAANRADERERFDGEEIGGSEVALLPRHSAG
jgi:hypothetical protein